jgi:NAD(P)H-hydrate epimerase
MLKILTSQEIKSVDAYTVEHEPVTSVDLMKRAASACVDWIVMNFGHNWDVSVWVGPGNNGGDGLAIARLLHHRQYKVTVYLLTEAARLSPDAAFHFECLQGHIRPIALNGSNFPTLDPHHLVIDALFGTGLSRPLDGLAAQAVTHINNGQSQVIAIDIPSGLRCEDNTHEGPIVRADHTLTFQQPKLSFFFAENAHFTGKWHVLDIKLLPEIIDRQPSKNFVLQTADMGQWFAPREKFSHKGHYGHACIVAGSRNMMGAAVLAVRACLRSGAGLVTAHVPHHESIIIQLSAPEALVSPDVHATVCTQIPDLNVYSAVAIGPGIGKHAATRQALIDFLQAIRSGKTKLIPLVLDADALNILSESDNGLDLLPVGSIITPHPKEFDRLAGPSANTYQRFLRQTAIARKHHIIVVLKGAHTTIASPDGACFFNTTGNPGMATGGSGDVLTGIIVSLLAQGWEPLMAACVGVWLHGAAGDRAAAKTGEQALIASDIVENLKIEIPLK